MLGIIAGKKGQQPAATPRTILDFCGEAILWHAPGRTVDAFIRAHARLAEIGVLDTSAVLEPPDRGRGYFGEWLDRPLTVKLSDHLWQIRETPRKRLSPKRRRQREPLLFVPSTVRRSAGKPGPDPAVEGRSVAATGRAGRLPGGDPPDALRLRAGAAAAAGRQGHRPSGHVAAGIAAVTVSRQAAFPTHAGNNLTHPDIRIHPSWRDVLSCGPLGLSQPACASA